MEIPKYKIALIVGAGEGLSASLARLFAREGIKVALAARKIEKLGALCTETGARAFACNATEAEEVERLFGMVEREMGTPDIVVYNASGRARGAFTDLVPADVAQAIAVSAFGGFLVLRHELLHRHVRPHEFCRFVLHGYGFRRLFGNLFPGFAVHRLALSPFRRVGVVTPLRSAAFTPLAVSSSRHELPPSYPWFGRMDVNWSSKPRFRAMSLGAIYCHGVPVFSP